MLQESVFKHAPHCPKMSKQSKQFEPGSLCSGAAFYQTDCQFYLIKSAVSITRRSAERVSPTYAPWGRQAPVLIRKEEAVWGGAGLGGGIKVHWAPLSLWNRTIDLTAHPIIHYLSLWQLGLFLAVIITCAFSYLVKPELRAIRLTPKPQRRTVSYICNCNSYQKAESDKRIAFLEAAASPPV